MSDLPALLGGRPLLADVPATEHDAAERWPLLAPTTRRRCSTCCAMAISARIR